MKTKMHLFFFRGGVKNISKEVKQTSPTFRKQDYFSKKYIQNVY